MTYKIKKKKKKKILNYKHTESDNNNIDLQKNVRLTSVIVTYQWYIARFFSTIKELRLLR